MSPFWVASTGVASYRVHQKKHLFHFKIGMVLLKWMGLNFKGGSFSPFWIFLSDMVSEKVRNIKYKIDKKQQTNIFSYTVIRIY